MPLEMLLTSRFEVELVGAKLAIWLQPASLRVKHEQCIMEHNSDQGSYIASASALFHRTTVDVLHSLFAARASQIGSLP